MCIQLLHYCHLVAAVVYCRWNLRLFHLIAKSGLSLRACSSPIDNDCSWGSWEASSLYLVIYEDTLWTKRCSVTLHWSVWGVFAFLWEHPLLQRNCANFMQAFQLWWQFVMHILQEPVFFCLSTSRLWEEVGVGGGCCHSTRGRVHSGEVASVSQG